MKRRRHSAEQVLGSGKTFEEAYKKLEISVETFDRRKHQFGPMDVDQAKWRSEVEYEQTRRQRLCRPSR